MKLSNHSTLLACLILAWSLPTLYAVAADLSPRYIVFASDPKFPSSEKSDNGEIESAANTEERSRWLINTQYSSIADFRTQSGGAATVPVMINGNLTASGLGSQRTYIRTVLQNKLDNVYDYGLGNHDYDLNVASCSSCAAGSVDDLKDRYWGKLQNMDLAARASGFTKIWYGSLAYSKDFGDVHLIQLHNEPTYAVNFSTQSFFNTTAYEITPSLDWLERDLQRARAEGKIILLNLHQPFSWPVKESEIMRFKKLIEDYGVTAVFSANAHKQSGMYESSNYIYGDIPLFMSGSATRQSWLYASFSTDRKQLTVYVIADNDWHNPVATHTIPVK
ncbi:metallophosphoesterase family protein [Pseudomonas sp. PGPR40]|uniref:metallophosphoesterase family protein n=1 Tax=Pseudomonas sp. PGPR40 TaxID=2913476 RepID=UPI001EDAC3F2|nr:phosphoesterase [Pseudomonas sp. PGPR40]